MCPFFQASEPSGTRFITGSTGSFFSGKCFEEGLAVLWEPYYTLIPARAFSWPGGLPTFPDDDLGGEPPHVDVMSTCTCLPTSVFTLNPLEVIRSTCFTLFRGTSRA